jgi:hypothetical protein
MDQPEPIQPPEATPPELVALDRIPFPPAVIAFAIVTAVAFVFALIRVPTAISAGVDFERGTRALKAGSAEKAVVYLEKVKAKYPGARAVEIKLALAEARAGKLLESALILQTFEGKEVGEDEKAELDEAGGILERSAPPDDTVPPAGKTGKN